MITEYDWLIGIGIMFGFALSMSYITYGTIESFFAFLTMFSGFVCWSELLPMWVLILNILILTFIMYFSLIKRGNI